MYNVFNMVIQYFHSKEDKAFAAMGAIAMYFHNFFTIDWIIRINASFTWQYFLSTFLWIVSLFVGAMVGVAGKNFYQWMEPKLLKFSKAQIVKFKNRKHAKKNNQRAA